MKKSRYSETQIAAILKEVETEKLVKDICRESGISGAIRIGYHLLKFIYEAIPFSVIQPPKRHFICQCGTAYIRPNGCLIKN